MKTCLTIPDYGSDARAWAKQTKNKTAIALSKKSHPRPWVAQRKDDGSLDFVKGTTDYHHSNSDGSKNVMVNFYLNIGDVYIVSFPRQTGGSQVITGSIDENGNIQQQETHRHQRS